jgi:hypothetical protein
LVPICRRKIEPIDPIAMTIMMNAIGALILRYTSKLLLIIYVVVNLR